jgi:hypothetical protein
MTAEIVSLADYRLARGKDAAASAPSVICPKRPAMQGRGLSTLVSRQDHRWADHRVERRHVVGGTYSPTLSVNGSRARLLNVSRNGLMAAGSRDITPGSRVLLTIAGCGPLSALVIWSRDGELGLEVPLELAGLELS